MNSIRRRRMYHRLNQRVPGELIYSWDDPSPVGLGHYDKFGYSVGVSTNYAIVGAYGEDSLVLANTNIGKAYIYNTNTGYQLHQLDNPAPDGGTSNDYFGYSVAISDSYAVVGSWQMDEVGETDTGKVYIFDVVTGALLHTLDNPNAYDTPAGDYFGWSVGISESYVVVGAPYEKISGGSQSGAIYVFNASTGALLHSILNPAVTLPPGDKFGESVGISEKYVIAGASYLTDPRGGFAYIFDVVTGALLHSIFDPNIVGSALSDYFGKSVAVTDTHAVVGAYNESTLTTSGSGVVYVFDAVTGIRLHDVVNPNAYGTSTGDYFGWSVSATPTHFIVGAINEDDGKGSQAGKAYIFDIVTGNLMYTLSNPNPDNASSTSDDYFGCAVGISDTCALVGAYNDRIDAVGNGGRAYLFDL